MNVSFQARCTLKYLFTSCKYFTVSYMANNRRIIFTTFIPKQKVYLFRFMTRLIIIYISISFTLVNPLYAEKYFTSLKYSDGLPSNLITTAVQDKYGYIWIGTDEGLCRYDGYNVLHFNQQSTKDKIQSNRISTLLADGDIIWIGTWNKLYTINIKTFEIKRISTGNIKIIRAFYKDKQDDIWIGTNDGLIHYLKKQDKYRFYNQENSNISHHTVRSINEDKLGNLWVGTFDGLNKFDGNNFTNYNIKGAYKPQVNNNLILSIQNDASSDSIIWVGTETGLCKLNVQNGSFFNYNSSSSNISNEVIKCIYEQNNELWLGTDFGLNIFNKKTKQIVSYYHNPYIQHTITNNVIWQIFSDNNDIIWLITSNGISLLENDRDGFSLHEVILETNSITSGNRIRDILVKADSTKWLATTNGVMAINNNGKKEIFTANHEIQNRQILLDNVFTIEEDKYNKLWIGTAGGINIWDANNKTMHSITANSRNGLSSNYISNICKSDNGTMWVSAWEAGIFQVNGDIKNIDNISFSNISSDGENLSTSSNNKLFFTSAFELYEYNPETTIVDTVFSLADSTFNYRFSAINSDMKGNIWLINKRALYKYQTKSRQTTIHYFKNPSKQILGLEVDKNGFIWIATHNTIVKYNSKGKPLLTLPINTSSPINNFANNCSTYGTDGYIYFGGQNGFVKINPLLTENASAKVNVHISGLNINNQKILPKNNTILSEDISFTSEITIPHNNNSLLFSFSNHDFWLPKTNSYSYKLIGFDQDWQFTEGQKNFTLYSNLRPGTYKLLVKGIDHKGIESVNTAEVSIIITPSIWLSTGFIVLYIILIVVLILSLFFIFNYRNTLKNKIKISELEKEHTVEILNKKQEFFTHISHEFRTPLALIAPTINQVLNEGKLDNKSRRMLQLADRNSSRLIMLINQILDYRKLESSKLNKICTPCDIDKLCKRTFQSFNDLAARNGINYKLITDSSSTSIIIDEQKIETILYNLLSNAFKFTLKNGSISLIIKTVMNDMQIIVKDTGHGIPEHEQKQIFEPFYQSEENSRNINGTGIGLALSLKYAEIHQGTISLNSTVNKGSSFTLTFPIIKAENYNDEKVSLSTNHNRESICSIKEETTLKSKTILVIDDNPDMVDFIELNLQHKYNILKTLRAKDGYNIAKSKNPDLIISDVMMPEMDGHELCRELKHCNNTMHIPIILLTAQSLDQQKLKGVKSGADIYITKPFEIEYLSTCIENMLKREDYLSSYIKRIAIISAKTESNKEDNQDTIFINKVMRFIELNVSEPSLSVENLASDLGISTTHLYRKLKSITGFSTQDLIKKYRLEKAANMLKNNEGNITEIMYAVGFSSLSAFSKAFKSHMHESPSMFQKKHATNNNYR